MSHIAHGGARAHDHVGGVTDEEGAILSDYILDCHYALVKSKESLWEKVRKEGNSLAVKMFETVERE